MLLLSITLTITAVLLYVLSPSLLLYSAPPWPVYVLLLGALVAAFLSGRRTRMLVVAVTVVLGVAVFYPHSVKTRTSTAELAIVVGDTFPAVTLPTSNGTVFSSVALRGRSAALYLFYRGDWCPFCRTELAAINEYYGAIRDAGVELYAGSVDPPEVSQRLRERLGVPFTFLADPHGELLDALGIRHRAGRDGQDIAYPAEILVDSDGIVRWTFRADSYRQRADPDHVLAASAALPPSIPP